MTSEEAEALFTRMQTALPKPVILSGKKYRRGNDIQDIEYLALCLLESAGGTMFPRDMIAGLGIKPAQVSRLLRSMEGHDRPLILCGLNKADHRMIDVAITPEGRKAMLKARATRVAAIAGVKP